MAESLNRNSMWPRLAACQAIGFREDVPQPRLLIACGRAVTYATGKMHSKQQAGRNPR
jgi:hypothetical protein